jgi:hypothetical protein
MNPIQHMNDVMEIMITEFLEQISETLELDFDELKEEYIEKPKRTPTECFLSRLDACKTKREKVEAESENGLKCIARIFNSDNGHTRGQCPCEQVDGCFCKRHSKKIVHGCINTPIVLMKQHDFRKNEQHYPITVNTVSYMYEPFSQKAIRLKDMKVFYIHSPDGVKVTISNKKKDNCVYKVRWNKANIQFLWNMTTKNIMDINTNEVIGTLDKCNKKWKLYINNQNE